MIRLLGQKSSLLHWNFQKIKQVIYISASMKSNQAYVFVVCGAKEHIDTLHFSLKSFQKNTQHPAIVITDSSRNETPIVHEHLIDIATPQELNHHQASIFLKTSVHRYLPAGGRYVYMDSDILAVGKHCDQIFDEYIPPIQFAPDHCTMPFFSPAALNCDCQEEYDKLIGSIKKYVDEIDHYASSKDSKILEQREVLKKRLVATFSNKWKFLKAGIRGFFSWPVFYFDDDFYYNRKEKLWYNSDHQPIMAQINWSKVAKKFDLKYDYLSMQIKDQKGKSIWVNQCDHLSEYIQDKFQIKVQNKKWQHWNGGVFIFDDQSHDFLESWHEATLEIFQDEKWKTRDQGTLIATAWKFGVQNQKTLDTSWNYICDYNNVLFGHNPQDGTLTTDQKKYKQPQFVHVYHHFGDKKWDFWNWITRDL